ncbi:MULTISPECIES: phospho-N-acetylmuramoyl-pentapeptide-transferase [Micromonospora]|uniref:Phospho-N-acetylmuramoyl-pentapeptide-transferase n=1 Tax=Micromonospora chalcea TaxID=1874 RepID=A0ABX9YDQ2_MICCH|nr:MULTISPECIES: phospho-N-acetylmuramoyl-pentapeptide-transferase [Micromonospora]EWM68521.1 phospho-N-acetylmuramoyl-pentapeptide-transferase [Micromonospora sp. M42]MBC8994230.1 phospho-N-acetylmuramoyl-pentapeptide-transferase [Micromonospora chalcea]MBP1784660.1 phospho-N-acetylmuramoyl-pentapeptide-transferase [Micromonospora sp. HB375]MBQ1063754.1 phospho-N-acetylmuramoyl-pentapeptide-transferase [Micromonospora sp. C41]MBQ1070166.1 phospho-N-acetylmuramoyl-pentapeptide-transferase [Mic
MRAVIVAIGVAFLISLFCTPIAIKVFARLKAGQPIRSNLGLASNEGKKGTPTMGGVVFILATVIAYVAGHLALTTLPDAQIAQVEPTITALVLLGLMVFSGAVGFIDDFLKVRKRHSGGLNKRGKLAGQILVGAVFGAVAVYFPSSMTDAGGNATNTETVASTTLSFIRDIPALEIGKIGSVIVIIMVVMAATNGVNLTDGLDGLATGASVMVLAAYALIAFWQYRHWCADPNYTEAYCYTVRDPLEIALIAGAAAGACVGFLWWNTSPARIFMGDTGALGLGGLIAGMAMSTRTILLLPILGGLFVIITMSVVIQIISFRTTGKRVFRMSPLQHHFELAGWSEVNIVVRFWIIAGIGVAIALGLFYSEFLAAVS